MLTLNIKSCCTEAELLDEIQTKVLRVFPPCYSQSSLQFSFIFFKLTKPLTVYKSSVTDTIKEKGGKTDRIRHPFPLPCGLRNTNRNLKSENSQDYLVCPETSTKLEVHEFGFCTSCKGKKEFGNKTMGYVSASCIPV